MKRILILLAVVAGLLGLTSCGGGGGTPAAVTTVRGVASKGIIRNGLVRVYALNADGTRGQLLKETETDNNGAYVAEFPEYRGAVLVEASGSYTDEASGATKTVPAASPLRAAVDHLDSQASIAVTPLTELAVQRTEDPVSHKVAVAQIAGNNAALSALFQVDIIATMPVDALSATPAATRAQKEHSLVLAAVSQLMQEKGEDLATAIAGLKSAIGEDGRLASSAAVEFRSALASFTASAGNRTGITDLLGSPLSAIGAIPRTLQLTVAGSQGALSALDFRVILPPGVLVEADAYGNLHSTALTPTSSASNALVTGAYTGATQAMRGSVTVGIISASGFPSGSFLTLTCQVVPGAAPADGDFQLTVIDAYDTNLTPISLTVSATLL